MAGELPDRIRRLAEAPCSMCESLVGGPPHHPTKDRFRFEAADRRAHDLFAIPLCAPCHDALHRLSGPFRGWSGPELRDWERDVQGRLWAESTDVF